MMETALINLKNRPYTITATVDLRDSSTNSMIIAQGGRFAGWTLYIKDGKIHHEYKFVGVQRTNISSDAAVPAGKHVIKTNFLMYRDQGRAASACSSWMEGGARIHSQDRALRLRR